MKHKEEQGHLAARVKRKFKKEDREQDEVERLEKEVRELKSINRSLLKQIKKLSKGINRQEYEEALEVVENGTGKEIKKDKASCEHCGRGKLIEVDIAGRKFLRCNHDGCGWKSGRIK